MSLVELHVQAPVQIKMHQRHVISLVWRAASAIMVLSLVETNVLHWPNVAVPMRTVITLLLWHSGVTRHALRNVPAVQDRSNVHPQSARLLKSVKFRMV